MSENHVTTDASRWQRLNEIFAAALAIESDKQAELLQELCDGDQELQREAEEILAATQNADRLGFLKADVFAAGARVLVANEIPPGTLIGPYRVIREIGRGGMGAVYLASREGFQQRVALKIIKRGMNTDAIVRRFVQERDVLASLNHPNIARLVDGGTTDDLPFIAMEYVEGETITEFCDQKRLTINERLVVFRKVCAAVAYAHQNLVIHRDIKPSNILIGKDGEPKLLDFGIAKLLSPDLTGNTIEQTATGANLMTPEYASPEQLRGEKITTASDIYSLGVLLYELLCGHRPFRLNNRSVIDVLQIISERQPPAPSTAAGTEEESLRPDGETRPIPSATVLAEMRSEKPARLQRKLVGDLDNIVLMALRKEPERRYNSVQQFAEDVRRHLDGRPVVARPATFSYRLSKFIERNRTATAFATLALVAILAGLSIAMREAVVARQQWARAERRSNEVRRLTNTMLKELAGEVQNLPQDRVAEKLQKVSIEYLNGLAQETNDPAVLKQLSEAYVQLGKQYGYEIANPDEMRANILRGLEISRRLVAEAPRDLDAKKLLAKNLEEYDYFCEKEPAEKLKITRERVRLYSEVTAAAPDDPQAYAELATAYDILNYLLSLYERPDEGSSYVRLAVQARERQIQLLKKTPATPRDLDQLSGAYMSLGAAAMDSKDVRTAEGYYTSALTVAESLVAQHSDYRLGWTRLTAANRELGNLRQEQGDYQSALNYFRAALGVLRDANTQLPEGARHDAEPNFMLPVAENLYRTGHADEALQMLREAIALKDRQSRLGETAATAADRKAYFLRQSGEVYAVCGQKEVALASYREAESLWKRMVETEPLHRARALVSLGGLCLIRGNLYAATRADWSEARNQYKKTIEIFAKLKAENQIGLRELRELVEAEQKLQALSN